MTDIEKQARKLIDSEASGPSLPTSADDAELTGVNDDDSYIIRRIVKEGGQ